MAVADGAAREVRLFAPSGVLAASSPGMGEGPGEFLGLDWLAECRVGQLDAYDPALGRVTTFSSVDLTVLDTRELRSSVDGGPPSAIRCFQGGWVGGTQHLQVPPSSPGPVQWPVSVELFGSDDQTSLVATMPGDERYFDGKNIGPLAFGSKSVFAASVRNIVIGTQSKPEGGDLRTHGRLVALGAVGCFRVASYRPGRRGAYGPVSRPNGPGACCTSEELRGHQSQVGAGCWSLHNFVVCRACLDLEGPGVALTKLGGLTPAPAPSRSRGRRRRTP